MKLRATIIASLLLALALPCFAQSYAPSWESLDKRQTPEWWQDAKFGIFIFWGVYSVPAYAPTNSENVYVKYAEHYMSRLYIKKTPAFVEHHNKYYGENFSYENFASQFTAQFFNADEWANLFARSGAKYVVLSSKHHDGYCLWPSKYSPRWNSTVLGSKRDLVGEFSEAINKSGLALGFYYSLLEWNHPLYTEKTLDAWVDQHMHPQMKELVETYKPKIFYTDGEWDYTSDKLKSEQFLSWLYNESSVKNDVVVNDRWGKETRSRHGGYYTTEYNLVHDDAAGVYSHPWEECRGIGGSFGYNRFENIENYSSAAELVHILIEKVSAGGNLLLDVGPKADGLIPVIMQERLLQMGEWLKVNGEAIYSTRKLTLPIKSKDEKVYFTVKGKDLYVLCTEWKESININIPGLKQPSKVELLGSPLKVSLGGRNGAYRLTAPQVNPNTMPCEHAWVYKLSNCL